MKYAILGAARLRYAQITRQGGGMARFGDLEAAVMDLMWAVDGPVRVRRVADEINRERPLAFNTVQTVMENLFRKGWLTRRKDAGVLVRRSAF